MTMNEIDDIEVTNAIIEESSERLKEIVDTDVLIVGAGPSGMTCARYLAEEGLNVVVLERNLSFGGGIWGGGTLLPRIVIQQPANEILEECGILLKQRGKLFTCDPVETAAKLASAAIDAGAKIIPGMLVEDVMVRQDEAGEFRVCGAVCIWNAIRLAGLHVDPLTFQTKFVVDATGHDADVVRTFFRKNKVGREVPGEKSMWAHVGEKKILENTKEVYNGLYVTGMAANSVYDSFRMGPIFGGMFMSGKKVAELIMEKMKE